MRVNFDCTMDFGTQLKPWIQDSFTSHMSVVAGKHAQRVFSPGCREGVLTLSRTEPKDIFFSVDLILGSQPVQTYLSSRVFLRLLQGSCTMMFSCLLLFFFCPLPASLCVQRSTCWRVHLSWPFSCRWRWACTWRKLEEVDAGAGGLVMIGDGWMVAVLRTVVCCLGVSGRVCPDGSDVSFSW